MKSQCRERWGKAICGRLLLPGGDLVYLGITIVPLTYTALQ